MLRSHLKKNIEDGNKMREFVTGMRENNNVLHQISDYNDRMRRRCQHELQAGKSEIDSQKNNIFILEQNRHLYSVKYDVLEEQFTLLFNSIESISNAKNLEDKFDQELLLVRKNCEHQSKENMVLSNYVRETTADRDQYRKSTLQLLESKKKLE